MTADFPLGGAISTAFGAEDWTVPAGVTALTVQGRGGGLGDYVTGDSAGIPAKTWLLYGVPVTPGQTISVTPGGTAASSATGLGVLAGGANGGGAGESAFDSSYVGYGGAGSVDVLLDGTPWFTAGGRGGAVRAGSLVPPDERWPASSTIPGSGAEPRVPDGYSSPGNPGDTHDGAQGIGGGGAGFGGGASGGYDGANFHAGKNGGSLLPAGSGSGTPNPTVDLAASSGPFGFFVVTYFDPAVRRSGWHVGAMKWGSGSPGSGGEG